MYPATSIDDGQPIVVHVHRAAPDELVHEGNSGLERQAFRTVAREIPSRKIGRRVYVSKADLIAYVRQGAPKPAADEGDPRAALAAKTRGRR
jgi:hypothetical protein